MNSTAPRPGPSRVDPAAITADVDAVLASQPRPDGPHAPEDSSPAAAQLHELEALHQRLAAALATIDKA
ncbi:hypothetical protein [Rhodococcus sp. X156]|uniref:hypothetical protein n=1 Tax=Rhodococcus sp. X156 TaxID=2499145 RepID=UPI000FD96EBA|nr:hypothetical protein [Rhodococcus sp. X156]